MVVIEVALIYFSFITLLPVLVEFCPSLLGLKPLTAFSSAVDFSRCAETFSCNYQIYLIVQFYFFISMCCCLSTTWYEKFRKTPGVHLKINVIHCCTYVIHPPSPPSPQTTFNKYCFLTKKPACCRHSSAYYYLNVCFKLRSSYTCCRWQDYKMAILIILEFWTRILMSWECSKCYIVLF